jgi:heme exporter protein A
MLWVLGANGSGKTSLLRLLCGLARPESGVVSWNGRDVRQSRDAFNADLLYAGHAPAIKDDLTALENLRFGLAQSGITATQARAQTALTQFGLDASGGVMARALSQGQRRRVGLARLALAASKPLWILDEPFTALDREATQLVQTHLEAQLQRGGSVVFTSHQEVDFGATRVTRLALAA